MTCKLWFESLLKDYDIEAFYYISLMTNLPSIVKYGILPQNMVLKKDVNYSSFADEEVQKRRDGRIVELSRSIWDERSQTWMPKYPNCPKVSGHDLVPLYFTSLTPTLYARKHLQEELVCIKVDPHIIFDTSVLFAFSDGNIAGQNTCYYNSLQDISLLPWDVIRAKYWTDFEDGKRKRNAEFLVYPFIAPKHFLGICANSQQSAEKAQCIVGDDAEILVDKKCFFDKGQVLCSIRWE